MNGEKTQTCAEYRIKADFPYDEKDNDPFFGRFGSYGVFISTDRGRINVGTILSFEMEGGGKKIINEEFLKILPKNKGEEITISQEDMKKYLQTKVKTEKEELTFEFEIGCNCAGCEKDEKRCPIKYKGEIVALEIDGKPRYFAK